MASTTDYLHLKLLGTTRDDKLQYFEDWRQDLNGETGESNMELIDAAYHEIDEAIQELEADVDELISALDGMTTATATDVGKALLVKTVENGEVTEWEFGEAVTLDDTLTHAGEAADAKEAGDRIGLLDDAVDGIEDDLEDLEEAINDLIVVSDEEPQTEDTMLWIEEDEDEETLVPSYAEFALQSEYIPGTVQTVTTDAYGNVTAITYTKDGDTFREDEFTYTANTITEVRTLSTGESMTIVTNLTTLETTVTYAVE